VAQSLEQAPPPRRSHGCLWGCLALALLLAVAAGGAFWWGNWYLTQGVKADPLLQKAMNVVRMSGTARDVLGDNIQIESVVSEHFVSTLGKGRTATYTATLKGTKSEATLHATLHSDGTGMKIVSIILTGPDGTRYNLTEDTQSPPPKSI
jgi:hypothetical protein